MQSVPIYKQGCNCYGDIDPISIADNQLPFVRLRELHGLHKVKYLFIIVGMQNLASLMFGM